MAINVNLKCTASAIEGVLAKLAENIKDIFFVRRWKAWG